MTIKIVNHSKHSLPDYNTALSAGMDLRTDIIEPDVLKSLYRALIPTGLFIESREGCEAQIRSRSSLDFKKGVSVLNTPGTIDADYHEAIGVIPVNLSKDDFIVIDGDRICQMNISKLETIKWEQIVELLEIGSVAGRFGHTENN
ncbi:MAG: dUTP diphosphatase [Bacteroidota bacterium]